MNGHYKDGLIILTHVSLLFAISKQKPLWVATIPYCGQNSMLAIISAKHFKACSSGSAQDQQNSQPIQHGYNIYSQNMEDIVFSSLEM